VRARDVVGKKIVAVRQRRVTLHGDRYYDVQSFDLDDGTRLTLVALEGEYEPFVHVAMTRLFAKGGER
jgi:hypothetical protein